MKILCLADLHLYFVQNKEKITEYKKQLFNLFSTIKCDLILIAGDIFESTIMQTQLNPYKELRNLFYFLENIPIICCLGNHEFAYSNIIDVKKYYNSFLERYNVHYLDIENYFEFKDLNIIGNVLWYDNSLKANSFIIDDKIDNTWLDSTIQNFIPSKECKQNKNLILNSIKQNKFNILLTHTVPHKNLNWFSIYEPKSKYNQYSGCFNFLNELNNKNIKYSICGHTHKYMNKFIKNIHCINIGNDYWNLNKNINYYLIEY